MGRELVRPAGRRGAQRRECATFGGRGWVETQRLCDRFRDEEADRHDTDKIHPLFNNASAGNSGSMIAYSREEWEPTFNICCTRAFLPMLQKAS